MDDTFGPRAHWEAEKYRARVQNDLRNGAVAGLIGGGSIMVLFLAYDLVLISPMATPEVLSELLPGGGTFGTSLTARLSVLRLVMFTALHLAVFTVLGMVLANLIPRDWCPEVAPVGWAVWPLCLHARPLCRPATVRCRVVV